MAINDDAVVLSLSSHLLPRAHRRVGYRSRPGPIRCFADQPDLLHGARVPRWGPGGLDARHEAKAKKYLQDFIISLAQPETLTLEPMIIPGVDGLEPAFILSTKGKVALRAKDEDTYKRLRELVVSGRAGEALSAIPKQMKDHPLIVKRKEQPSPIHKHVTMNLGNIYRSATKVALELACVISDASWLTDPCFERAKTFAMGPDVNLDEFSPVRETRDDITFPELEGKHLAMVSRMGTNLVVYLMLYQKPGWLIRLTEDLPDSFPLDVPAIFLFDYRGRNHRRLDWGRELDEIAHLMQMGALTPPTGIQAVADKEFPPSH